MASAVIPSVLQTTTSGSYVPTILGSCVLMKYNQLILIDFKEGWSTALVLSLS